MKSGLAAKAYSLKELLPNKGTGPMGFFRTVPFWVLYLVFYVVFVIVVWTLPPTVSFVVTITLCVLLYLVGVLRCYANNEKFTWRSQLLGFSMGLGLAAVLMGIMLFVTQVLPHVIVYFWP